VALEKRPFDDVYAHDEGGGVWLPLQLAVSGVAPAFTGPGGQPHHRLLSAGAGVRGQGSGVNSIDSEFEELSN